MITSPPTPAFAAALIDWQRRHGRHDLPWQATTDPYRVWLSEIMLQQTQVTTVIPYYERFLARFPTLAALAAAPVEEVMGLWSGLGYYARARNLHACARHVAECHDGVFPRDAAALAALPGIGRSTANAIAVFAFGACAPILDGNVKRVLCRSFGIDGFPGAVATERALWQLAAELLPARDCAVYIQAQMDLGATICTRTRPRCDSCPLTPQCVALATGRTALLPTPRPRRTVPERAQTLLVLFAQGRVLLEKRPPTGIWGGLWSLPELPVDQAPLTYARTLGCSVTHFEERPILSHAFTHFRLQLRPLLGRGEAMPVVGEAERIWVEPGALAAAPLPAPIRKLLSAIP